MKKLIILVLVGILTTGSIIYLLGFNDNKVNVENYSLSPTPAQKEFKKVNYKSEDFEYLYFIVEDPKKLSLIPNFENKYSSKELMDRNGCVSGINGGFYSEQDKPIGEFITGGRLVSGFQKNSLFNGFLKIGIDNEIYIGYDLNSEDARIFLQTGPVVIHENVPVELTLARDKKARRMVAMIDSRNTLIFMTIFKASSRLDGPYLIDLGKIMKQIPEFEIRTAINLDGGAASAFYNPEISVSEWQNVGSWWCYK